MRIKAIVDRRLASFLGRQGVTPTHGDLALIAAKVEGTIAGIVLPLSIRGSDYAIRHFPRGQDTFGGMPCWYYESDLGRAGAWRKIIREDGLVLIEASMDDLEAHLGLGPIGKEGA